MHLGFILDHPKRDLPGAVALAHAAAKRNHEVSIIPMYEQGVDVPLLGLDALIVNFVRTANRDLIRGYHDYGLPIFVLDTEGGILAETGANSLQKFPQVVRQSGVADLLAGYLFWGTRLRDAFEADGVVSSARLHVTGCPRFDVASPRWSPTLRYSRKGFLLANTNFPLVNSRFSASREVEKQTMMDAGWTADYLDGMIADQTEILRGFIAAVRTTAERNPALEILLRPHPFENSRLYEEAFSGCRNVVVDGSGSVLNVIQNSLGVLHLNCGTSVEATMLRRLPISMEFLNTRRMRNHTRLPSQISWPVDSLDELQAAIPRLDAIRGGFDFESRYDEHIRPWFHLNDGRAAERVLDVVLGEVAPQSSRRTSVRRSLKSSRPDSRLMQRLQAAAANLFGSMAVSRLRDQFATLRRIKRVDSSQVELGLRQLALHEGTNPARARRARHPVSALPLASITVSQ